MKHSLVRTAIAAMSICAGITAASAQQSDVEKVKAVLDSLHAGLSQKAPDKIMELFASDPKIMAIQPRGKEIAVGVDDVRKSFGEATATWSEFKVTQAAGPNVQISGNVAWTTGTGSVNGKLTSGATVSAPTFEADVLEKRGDRWLIVSHAAWRVPE